MSSHELTDRQFWLDYWRKAEILPVSTEPFFKKWLRYFPAAPARFIEIGGFPGNHSAYFKKFLRYDVTLLDFVVDREVIKTVEQVNDLEVGGIQVIQTEFVHAQPASRYDVVFSAGFIEHFTDTDLLFRKHCEFLADDGTLFISLPNFNGITGWVQKWLDPKNYSAHSLQSMNLKLLEQLCVRYHLKPHFIGYDGVPHLWLDHPERNSKLERILVRAVSYLLQQTRGLIQGRWISPYIVVVAQGFQKR